MTQPAEPPMARPRVAAGALIRGSGETVLLVRPTYKDGWDIPGGYVEPGESPAAACARELVEEIGLHLVVRQLLVVDWAPHPDEGDKLLFVFDGGEMSGYEVAALRPDGEEIAEVRFHGMNDLSRLMPERLARRLRTAIAAARDGTPTYAEQGDQPRTARAS